MNCSERTPPRAARCDSHPAGLRSRGVSGFCRHMHTRRSDAKDTEAKWSAPEKRERVPSLVALRMPAAFWRRRLAPQFGGANARSSWAELPPRTDCLDVSTIAGVRVR